MRYEKNKELVKRARVLRSNMTQPETILWSRLKSKNIYGYKFRRQQPIFDYIIDFYCHELKLIVEVDGEIHALIENADSDKKRENMLRTNGYHILRFTNFDIHNDIETVIDKIKEYITTNLSPFQGDQRESVNE
jgi:very-short-patch-repair endonuclease